MKEKPKILLVDDFIGSGETAIGALSYLTQDLSISGSKIIMLFLVAQNEGIQNVKEQFKDIQIYCPIIRVKGINYRDGAGFTP